MASCNILDWGLLHEYYINNISDAGMGNPITIDLCCYSSLPMTYDTFVSGVETLYDNQCLRDREYSDYITQLFTECLSGAATSHTHTTDSYWSANTDGSISNSGLTSTNVGIGTHVPSEMLHVSGNTKIRNSLDVGTTMGVSGNTYVGGVLGVSGVTYLGNDLHIKDDQFIYFGAEADNETRIRRTSNNLKIEAADDIIILPDDDLKIGVGGGQYAVFDGGTTSLIVGATSVPTARLTLKIGTQTTNFDELALAEGCSAHDLYADMVTDQASTMRLLFGETTIDEGGNNHTFVIFPSPSELPNETYSADIVLGGYAAAAGCATEILRIDGSTSRVGIKQQTPLYDLDVTGTFRATTNAVIGGDIDVDGVTNLDNTDIDGTFTMDGTAFDINGTTTVAIDNTNTTNGVTINTVTSGSKVFIGHTTSETTVNDNLTVRGDATIPTRKYELPSSTVGDFKGGDIYYYGDGSTVKGSIYYINGTNWTLADADLVASSTVLLAVALGTDPDVDGMLLRGFVTLLTEVEGTEAIGSVLYLSATDTGIATTTAPSGAGDVVRVIGYSLHATDNQIYFNPDPTWVELS